MRKNLICTVTLIGNLLFSQVGINTDSPDSSAALDIQSIDKTGSNKTGILIPRVELDSLRDISNNPARGLLVYNTKTQNDVVEDNFYYFDGDKWDLLLAKNKSKTMPEIAALYRLEGNDIPLLRKSTYVDTEGRIVIYGKKTVILFDRNILTQDNHTNHLVDYDTSTGIFTIKQDGIYSITLQVGLVGVFPNVDNIIGIIAAEETSRERKNYKVNDWMGRATFASADPKNGNRTFGVYTTYLKFRKGEKFQAAAFAEYLGEIRTAREGTIQVPATSIQGIQTGLTGEGNVTNISIVKY